MLVDRAAPEALSVMLPVSAADAAADPLSGIEVVMAFVSAATAAAEPLSGIEVVMTFVSLATAAAEPLSVIAVVMALVSAATAAAEPLSVIEVVMDGVSAAIALMLVDSTAPEVLSVMLPVRVAPAAAEPLRVIAVVMVLVSAATATAEPLSVIAVVIEPVTDATAAIEPESDVSLGWTGWSPTNVDSGAATRAGSCVEELETLRGLMGDMLFVPLEVAVDHRVRSGPVVPKQKRARNRDHQTTLRELPDEAVADGSGESSLA